ncbi:MAG: SirB2 family protein [Betaproteobacteria bacterium]|nr:SirB2 family protein [Betaproteobacteria bacterium]
MYAALKLLHLACVTLSVVLFVWRWQLALQDSVMLRRNWLKFLPRVNDSLLLAAAIGLMVLSGKYPWEQAWLAAKVLALIAYIGLGSVALRARRIVVRRSAGLAALIAAAYIVSVALSKNPRGFLASI